MEVFHTGHRHGHGSKHAPRPVGGPVLIIYVKRRRVTEMGVKTVVLQTAMAVAVDRDTTEHVVRTVS